MKNNEDKNKKPQKFMLKKLFVLTACMSLLFFITDPKFVLSNIMDPIKVLGGLYSECVNLCFAYTIAVLIGSKSNKLKIALTFLFAILLNTFFETDFKGEFIQENITIVIFASVLIITTTTYMLFYEQIEKFFLSKERWSMLIVFYILSAVVMILAIAGFVVYFISYYKFYGFRWTNVIV